jgi:DivIVA domain-containing protein
LVLTPEDVVNKRFTVTKFREGYDQDEVDDFLDSVVVEFRRLAAENDELKSRIKAQDSGLSEPAPTPVKEFPTQLSVDPQDTTNSHSLLQLARKLHEEHVREGLTKRDQLIRDGQENASRIVREAETQARSVISQLELDRKAIENTIDELRDFENDYRGRLREYIESQLDTLLREESFESTDAAYEAVITPEIAAAQAQALEAEAEAEAESASSNESASADATAGSLQADETVAGDSKDESEEGTQASSAR